VSDQASDQVNDQARFAAREFVARWARETGELLSAVVTDRMLFAYEMGYLRGRSNATEDAVTMFDEIARAREEARKKIDDDSK
jgi:hypothetical protein